jgi:ferredoxin
MSHRKHESYSENASGDFYVEQDMCIACRAPESVAPDLVGFYEDPSGTGRESHCYFKKQPETAEEMSRAIKAICISCCGAYRYAGSVPEVKEKTQKRRLRHGDQLVGQTEDGGIVAE